MVKYSIILRAYNVEDNVWRSIESIIQQKYQNWELLIVNDGSTDNTGVVCETYASRDKRIKVIHQVNKGCLLATQTGVKNASGEYICLLDSDDWYEEDYLECIDSIACGNDVDMIVANYYTVDLIKEKTKFSITKDDFITDNMEAMRIFFETTNYALWNKVVKKKKIEYTFEELQFFVKNGKTTNFGEDLYQLMPVLCGCNKVYFLSKYLYNYVVDQESISHQRVKNQWEDLIKRNRLMEFTYEAIATRVGISEKIQELIEYNTLKILLPNILEIVRNHIVDKTAVKYLKKNEFYKNIILKTRIWYIKEKFGKKRAVAFWIFKCRVYFGI